MKTIFRSRLILISMTFLILLITLYFGLRFRGFRLKNDVTRLYNEPGLHFGWYGIAYGIIDNSGRNKISSSKEFSIEMALRTQSIRTYRFSSIMSINGGKDNDQLIIGQWKSDLVIMNGDDYSNRRKLKKIYAYIFKRPFKNIMLTIKTGYKGTVLFVNGKLIKRVPDLHLTIPSESRPIFTLGNSVYGTNSWRGNIYGFALYDYNLPHEKIENHFNIWKKTGSFTPFRKDNPCLFIDFNGNEKTESANSVNGISELNIPFNFPVLKKRILEAPWIGINNFRDMTVNLLGFIPLGFIIFALISNLAKTPQKRIILITVLICFFISLFIEIAQAWIPSRTSQCLDLILNTAGGYLGASIAKRLVHQQSPGREG